MFTHKLSLMSLPPWVQQDYHRFICSCLLLVKIEKSHMRSCFLWIEFWILGEKSWCHWNSLPWTCMSRCLCLNLRKSWSSPRVQKSLTSQMRAFPSYLSTFLALLLSLWPGLLSFPLPHIYTYLLVISLLNSQYSLDRNPSCSGLVLLFMMLIVNCAMCLFSSTRFALYQLKNFLQNTWNLKYSA